MMVEMKMKTKDLNKLPVGELEAEIVRLKKLRNEATTSTEHPWRIGEKYLIRTVTMILTGRLTAVYEQELVLGECAWIADTGRFMEATEKGSFDEVEPWKTDEVIVGRGSIIDAGVVVFDLPKKQK